MRKNTTTTTLKNKKMNTEVYALRKKAMAFIYEARQLADLPRIEIRITERHERILGLARMKDNVVWISESAIRQKKYDLRTLVFHEILHAVYGVEHDENCPLMKPIHTPLTKKQNEKLFKKWSSKKGA